MKTGKFITGIFFLLLSASIYAVNLSHPPLSKTFSDQLAIGHVYLNLDQATAGVGYVDIPVFYTSAANIISLDFALKFNENVLSFREILNSNSNISALGNYDTGDKTLFLTTYSLNGTYIPNTTIVTVRFNIIGGGIHNSDFSSFVGYLNGDLVQASIKGNLNDYIIGTITGLCTEPSFCLPVIAFDSVKNIIGYDLVLNYDKSKVHPSGNITVNNALINPAYVSYVAKDEAINGLINISIFLNSTAPAAASFTGTGDLICVEFLKNTSFHPGDTALFTCSSLQESYANGVSGKLADAGKYINQKSTTHNGTLKFWTDGSPIRYNSANPAQYLITNIYGADSSCNNKSVATVQPNLAGNFSYNILNGTSLQIERDILPITNVQPVINGFDAGLGHKVLVNDLSFIPNIYQIIALDVNTDGTVSAGDISQINQRSVKTIPEFKQKWNYNNNGTSNGQTSKDWLFLDSILLADPAYKKSLNYPLNDGIGYSKYNVPVVPFCLPLPVSSDTSCSSANYKAYTGVLLGDVDGNYDSIPADGQIKRIANEVTQGTIYLNLDEAIYGAGYIDIPVSFISPQKVVSLDFALKYNERVMGYEKITGSASYLSDAMAHYAKDDKTLRFTSNSSQPYEEYKAISFVRFKMASGELQEKDFSELTGYLNGKCVGMELKGSITTNITQVLGTTIQVYPNPASNVINIVAPEKVTVELMDLEGKQIFIHTLVNANEKQEINTRKYTTGTYLLKIYNDHFVSTERIVIENK